MISWAKSSPGFISGKPSTGITCMGFTAIFSPELLGKKPRPSLSILPFLQKPFMPIMG
jgi:hypothetical protein